MGHPVVESDWMPAWPPDRIGVMVRPERIVDLDDSRCIELAGASPVAVSAAAPRSRPRASRETSPSEWGVKSPQRAVRLVGGEQVRRPSIKRTLQPREIRIRKETGRPSRSCHGEGNRLCPRSGWTQDARGVERTACGQSSMRNRRDPSRRPRRAYALPQVRRRRCL